MTEIYVPAAAPGEGLDGIGKGTVTLFKINKAFFPAMRRIDVEDD